MSQESPASYRYRRRNVVQIRWTWLGQVFVLLLLVHLLAMQALGIERITTQAALFVGIVVVPLVLVALWRAGLLPPERVRVDGPPADDEPRA